MATEDGPHHRQRRLGHRTAPAAAVAQHPALPHVDGHEVLGGLTPDTGVQRRCQALVGQCLEEECRNQQRRRSLVERAQRPDEHVVSAPVALPLRCQALSHLQQGRRLGEAVGVGPQRHERVEALGLGDDLQVAAPPVELHIDMAGGLEPAAELRTGLAHTLGDGPDLSVAGRQQGQDAVGLAQLPGVQHHRPVPVQGHQAPASEPDCTTRRPLRRSAGPGPGIP